MSLTKDLFSQFTTSLFHHPTSRDLRSHRTGYHYSKFQVGLKPISLDALSIILRDRPLVNWSARLLDVWTWSNAITPEFLNFLIDFSRRLTCLVDFMLSLELLTFVITVWLSQFIEIAGMSFSTIGKSIRRSRSHLASDPTVSNVVSSASIIDFVKIVCLQDFQETAPPPSENTYPLVA